MEEVVLLFAKSADCLGSRRIFRPTIRQGDAPRCEKADYPLVAGFPVHVLTVVAFDIEWLKGLTCPRGTAFKEAVEQLLPCSGVQARSLRNNPIKVQGGGIECRQIHERAFLIRLGDSIRHGTPAVHVHTTAVQTRIVQFCRCPFGSGSPVLKRRIVAPELPTPLPVSATILAAHHPRADDMQPADPMLEALGIGFELLAPRPEERDSGDRTTGWVNALDIGRKFSVSNSPPPAPRERIRHLPPRHARLRSHRNHDQVADRSECVPAGSRGESKLRTPCTCSSPALVAQDITRGR